MSKLTSLFLIIVFFISVFIGITVGITFKQGQELPTPTPTSCLVSNDTIGALLVLGVTSFDTENVYLESAWLVTINQTQRSGENHIEVLLISLYPLSDGQIVNPNQSQYLSPHAPISFPREFLDNLNAKELLRTIPFLNRPDLFYQDVIVIDEYAMNYIIQLANANPIVPPAPPTDDTFCKPWDHPEMALSIQHNILETLCSSPQNILEYQNFTQVFNLFPDHFKSTITPDEILAFWQVNVNLASPPTISCSIYP